MKCVVLIGYSGHAFVVADTLVSRGRELRGYCDREAKTLNPFDLPYLGPETADAVRRILREVPFFVSIGSNAIRQRVYGNLTDAGFVPATAAVHPTAWISPSARIGDGTLVAPQVTINALVYVGEGGILNTGCTVEHECVIGRFAHIAPGCVLAGNVTVGEGAFVGAGSVVKQGVHIGPNATVGAGAVVLNDVKAGDTVAGNPARLLTR